MARSKRTTVAPGNTRGTRAIHALQNRFTHSVLVYNENLDITNKIVVLYFEYKTYRAIVYL